jgi:NADH-quinone oxidoreductase subunit J
MKNTFIFLLFFFIFFNLFIFFTSSLVGFFFFAINIIMSALMVVFSRNPINSLFFLIATFFNTSIFLVLLDMDFLAIVFIIVYVGAIAVFFLFMIMLLNISSYGTFFLSPVEKVCNLIYLLTASIGSGTLLVQFLRLGLEKNMFSSLNPTQLKFGFFELHKNIYGLIGHFFYTYYGFSLILISVFLLILMVGVIILPVFSQKYRVTIYKSNPIFLKTLD